VFADAPLEDIPEYKDIYAGFLKFLAEKIGRKIEYRVMRFNSEGIEDMRAGKLHIASFSTGATNYAVNLAGYIPIAVKGTSKGFQGYRLIVVVRADSPLKKLSDIVGKTVAHTAPSSNSGHIAAMGLFPQEGIVPGKDYTIAFSGNHERSVLGVLNKEYDAACVGSSLFERIAAAGGINPADYRILWQSPVFPTSSFGYVYNLNPTLAGKIREAFAEYRFTPEMIKAFGGMDRFYPVTYLRAYAVSRLIADFAGEKFNEAGLRKLAESERKAAMKGQ
jgi:phosphonate transport system substrate-binding protein